MCKPVYETCEREVCYTVCKPVTLHARRSRCCCGHWETRLQLLRAAATTAALRPAAAACLPVPRVGARRSSERQIQCTKYVRETCVKKVPYTVCRMVPEQRVKTCTYQVCHMVKELCEKRIPYTVCQMVPEQHVKTCTYQVCHMVQEQPC